MLLKAGLRHVLATPLRLHVAIGQRLLGIHPNVRHVAWRHVALRNAGSALLRGQMGACGLLGRVNSIAVVYTVVAGRGLRGVQAGLGCSSV